MKSVIIAGTHSGAGKTTITIALMSLLTKLGKKVAPFKIGPDYIDPQFHYAGTGRISHNLDSFLLDETTVKYLFYKNSVGCDLAVIEGVMGLFDGTGYQTDGSTAHVSRILQIPVILIIDAVGVSTSVCAMVLGFKLFDPQVNLQGVILNNISHETHYQALKKSIESTTNTACLGYFPRMNSIELKSRQLGLIPAGEIDGIQQKISRLAAIAEKSIDLNRLLVIMAEHAPKLEETKSVYSIDHHTELTIGIANDEAFNFYYHDNLQLMKEYGIRLIEFSPLKDHLIPEGIDGLYIGGGFPEEFASRLSDNKSMRADFLQKLEEGLPVYAECGGLMYLTESISDKNGISYPMVGFFNCTAYMTEKLQRFGYTEVEYSSIIIRAHEFHHSALNIPRYPNFEYKYRVKNKFKKMEWLCGLSRKNVLAGYPHIHFYANLDFFEKILEIYNRKQVI